MSWLVQVDSPLPFIIAVVVAIMISFMVTARQPRR